MMKKIITIDNEKCIGCGLCANACKQSAIGMVEGKAKLLHDDYCDGLGNCLPVCPTNAISFIEKEVHMSSNKTSTDILLGKKETNNIACDCPSKNSKTIERDKKDSFISTEFKSIATYLNQWPVQIKLVSENASYLDNAKLLIAADCGAYAYGNFHQEFMKNKVTIIGCPKLDDIDYSVKFTAILKNNNIKSVTVVRMEVPCCGGLENAMTIALKNCGKLIPWEIITLTTDGEILEV